MPASLKNNDLTLGYSTSDLVPSYRTWKANGSSNHWAVVTQMGERTGRSSPGSCCHLGSDGEDGLSPHVYFCLYNTAF